jgi:hypothetical protein
MFTYPLLPLLVVPVVNDKWPLTPLAPAFTVSMVNPPLLVAEPEPVLSLTDPPVAAELSPA